MYSKCEFHTFTLHVLFILDYLGIPKRGVSADTGLHRPSPAERRTWPPTAILQLARDDNLIQMQWIFSCERIDGGCRRGDGGDGGNLTCVKYSTQKKTLKITNSLSFLINVLTILNQLNIPLSTWGQNTNLPSTSVLPCSALANVEISGNLFGSCRCHVHSSLRTRIGEPTVQLST